MDIDGKKAVELLRSAVERRGGDTVVRSDGCFYVRDGAPSCLLGEVLTEFIDKDSFLSLENDSEINGGYITTSSVQKWFSAEGVNLTPGGLRVLEEAQNCQDSGMTWSRALIEAERVND